MDDRGSLAVQGLGFGPLPPRPGLREPASMTDIDSAPNPNSAGLWEES